MLDILVSREKCLLMIPVPALIVVLDVPKEPKV
jgi:hypothetical protein